MSEYPEEPGRGAEFGSDADIERERERGLGNEDEDRARTSEAPGRIEGAAGNDRLGNGSDRFGSDRFGTDRYGDTGTGVDTGAGTGTGSDPAEVPGRNIPAGGADVSGYGAPGGAAEQTGYDTTAGYRGENGTGYGTGTNGAMDGTQDDIVIAPEQNSGFRTRWREVQAEFIDDPQRAAKDADQLVAEITKVFAAQAEEERNRLASAWQQQKGAQGTEELRQVMRRYRGLIDHMLDQ